MASNTTIALVSPNAPQTGNRATSQRIAAHLQHCGYDVLHISDRSGDDGAEEIIAAGAKAAIVLHAYRGGQVLLSIKDKLPYAVVFGGTDLTDPRYIEDKDKAAVTATIVHSAKVHVAFSGVMSAQASNLWPDNSATTKIIPQACCPLNVDKSFSFHSHLSRLLGPQDPSLDWSSSATKLLLLPAGIRPVKDVLFGAPEISEWHRHSQEIRLVIVGPVLDQSYYDFVRAQSTHLPGVFIIPPLDSAKLCSAICESLAVLNTSISEGMCGTILEAMHLGTPVIARDIPQNCAIVENRSSGLTFHNGETLVGVARELMRDSALRSTLIEGGKDYIERDRKSVV